MGNQILDKAYLDMLSYKEGLDKQREVCNDILDSNKKQAPQCSDNDAKNAQVYLMFSVNKSKHFCGVAVMKDRVRTDIHHDKLWKQAGKWPGSIKIEWLHVKDIPNTQFIHIENPLNENKPVCQGRDCQEIYPRVGEKMLQIF